MFAAVIPKTSTADRVKENAAIFDFQLSSEDIEALGSLNQNHHYCWDPTDIA